MARPRKGGKMYWTPMEFDREVRNVMIEDDLTSKSEAIRKVVKYSQLGREARRAGINPTIPLVNTNFMTLDREKRKKKKDDW